MSLKAVLVEDDTLVGIGLKTPLEGLGYTVCGQAGTAPEAKSLCESCKPDLLLLDIRLADADGLTLLPQLQEQHHCPTVVVSAYSDNELITRAGQAGVFGYLIKPVTREALAAQIGVANQRFKEREKLMDEKQELVTTLEARKLMDRAKGILMRHQHIDEPTAHRKLQTESQRRRISMSDLCRKIIESEELLSEGGVSFVVVVAVSAIPHRSEAAETAVDTTA